MSSLGYLGLLTMAQPVRTWIPKNVVSIGQKNICKTSIGGIDIYFLNSKRGRKKL